MRWKGAHTTEANRSRVGIWCSETLKSVVEDGKGECATQPILNQDKIKLIYLTIPSFSEPSGSFPSFPTVDSEEGVRDPLNTVPKKVVRKPSSSRKGEIKKRAHTRSHSP